MGNTTIEMVTWSIFDLNVFITHFKVDQKFMNVNWIRLGASMCVCVCFFLVERLFLFVCVLGFV